MCQKLSAKNAPKIFTAKAGYKMLAKWTPRGFPKNILKHF